MLLPMDFDLATIIAALAGAGGWGIVHVLLGKKKNGDNPDRFAVHMIEQDNLRLRQEKSFLERENDELKGRILKLEKQVHELELKIKAIEGKI